MTKKRQPPFPQAFQHFTDQTITDRDPWFWLCTCHIWKYIDCNCHQCVRKTFSEFLKISFSFSCVMIVCWKTKYLKVIWCYKKAWQCSWCPQISVLKSQPFFFILEHHLPLSCDKIKNWPKKSQKKTNTKKNRKWPRATNRKPLAVAIGLNWQQKNSSVQQKVPPITFQILPPISKCFLWAPYWMDTWDISVQNSSRSILSEDTRAERPNCDLWAKQHHCKLWLLSV